MTDELKTVATVLAVLIALANWYHTKFQTEVAIRDRIKNLEDNKESSKAYFEQQYEYIIGRLVNIESNTHEFPVYKAKMDVFWRAVEEQVPQMLMHHDEYRRDVLLMKSKDKTITTEEAAELSAMLKVDIHHKDREDGERIFALLWSIKMDYKSQRLE